MSGERRLVIITFHYPPDGFVGGLRWAGFTRHLARQGWQCEVVTAATGMRSQEPGVTVHAVPRRPTLNDAYRRWREGSAAPQTAAVDAVSSRHSVETPALWRRAVARLRLEAGQALSTPDEARGWVIRAARRARRLVRERRADAVVTSGPPHSAHIAGWLATRGTGVRWIADFRDPWAHLDSAAWVDMPHARSWLARGLRGSLERLVVRAADRVVCNTSQMCGHFAQRHPGLQPTWIPNGVDRDRLPPRPAERFAGLGIAHLGTIYGGRDLTPALEALARFLADRSPASDGSMLRIAGNVAPSDLDRLHGGAAARGLAGRVEYLGILPRAQALDIAGRSRLALVLAQQQELQVPAKLYELIGMGIPTLVLGPLDGAAATEARRLGAYAAAEDDIDAIARVFTAVANGPDVSHVPPTPLDYAELAPLMSQAMMGQSVADLLHSPGGALTTY